jgi:hypothetical protein
MAPQTTTVSGDDGYPCDSEALSESNVFGLGGGGGYGPGNAPKVQVTNVSQSPPKQEMIGHMLSRLMAALACDADCMSFLSQNGLDPVQTLSDIISNNLYGYADISENGNPSRVSAASNTGIQGQAITVNSHGAFFVGNGLKEGPNNIPGNTPMAQAFILLHELGHNTTALRPDGPGTPTGTGQLNDQQIQDHCAKTIDSFAQ